MSSVSDWERKRTMERMFMNVPPQQRESYLAQVKKEQDKMDKENAGEKDKPENDEPSFLIAAPEIAPDEDDAPASIADADDDDKPTFLKKEAEPFGGKQAPPFKKKEGDVPFVKSREQVTGVAAPVGEPHGDDQHDDPKMDAVPSQYGTPSEAKPFAMTAAQAASSFVSSILPSLKGTGNDLEDAVLDYATGVSADPEDVYERVLVLLKSKGIDPKKIGEALTGNMGLITPQPMLVATEPGTEVSDDVLGHCAITSSGTDNGHTHMAYYDDAGNGYTSHDDGHCHVVRSFIVGDIQSPDGVRQHAHQGVLPRPEVTPGQAYMPYDGVMQG